MAKVAVLVPYLEMREIARPMLEGYDHIQAMCVEYATTDTIAERARTLEAQGCELIVSRGLQARIIRPLLKIPVVEMRILLGMRPDREADCPFIIVLGAHIQGTKVTGSLSRRLEAAVTYLESHPGTAVIVSGGMGKGEAITEAGAMEAYLRARGISPERILKEDRSTSTRENFAFSSAFIPDKTEPVGVVTNNFHMYRAKEYARRTGYKNPRAIPASSSAVLFLNYAVREFFAVWKMWIFR